jgi:hypothetical protein
MRTTLDIADDVLRAAKELARRQKKTAGEMISELARKGLRSAPSHEAKEPKEIHGFRPFRSRGGVVTNEIVDRLRDEELD